ncbi:hypothetical protein [Limnoraphis robusta]|uniref:Uncharacterized protein n=1 Tax=Limnoraphis robusta CS-951 TaxID=1637645 RepID=A0A0F5YJ53_9CYAN|nr:hypothetical protein [Limnoraphis robusta]KKD38921.1 hypothetical protein WN50_06320 [Limnoraphis robusta CS-951]
MPGADLPPNFNSSDPTPPTDSQLLESNETSAPLSHLSQTSDEYYSEDEEWETVNLPDAISVDQLPVRETSEEERSTPEVIDERLASRGIEVRVGESENLSQLIQALHQCNQDLINRVTSLETELDECKKQLNDQNHLLNQRNQDLVFAQDQVSRLFGKLELSNQVIRRQQVLVETLSEQWETSQTRMAQMERECAIAQQRYNEQFHELVQAQNVGRELRSRLHRQQRHTLQFKAALERCLEMQPRLDQATQTEPKTTLNLPKIESVNQADSSNQSPTMELSAYPIAVSRSQPVKPWSADTQTDSDSVERLDEIVRQEQEYDDFDEELVDEWLELDEADSAQPDDSSHYQQDFQNPQFSERADLGELESYWHLKNPSDPTLTSNPFEEADDPSSQLDQLSGIEPSPRFVEEELDRIRIEYASSTIPSFDLQMGKSGFIPSPNQPLDQLHRGSDKQQESVSSTRRTANSPAPLIQPTRHQKLRSLAAIELPKFPQYKPVERVVIASNYEAEPF